MHATTMKTKRHYTTPVTQRATVELEGGFCSSIYGPGTVEASEHKTGTEVDFSDAKFNESTESYESGSFSLSSWD